MCWILFCCFSHFLKGPSKGRNSWEPGLNFQRLRRTAHYTAKTFFRSPFPHSLGKRCMNMSLRHHVFGGLCDTSTLHIWMASLRSIHITYTLDGEPAINTQCVTGWQVYYEKAEAENVEKSREKAKQSKSVRFSKEKAAVHARRAVLFAFLSF